MTLDVVSKYVPTDMDWHTCFAGNRCMVSLYRLPFRDGKAGRTWDSYSVTVRGCDDTHVQRWFRDEDAEEKAIVLYDSIRHVQSRADLAAFEGSTDNNGWPTPRRLRGYNAQGGPKSGEHDIDGGLLDDVDLGNLGWGIYSGVYDGDAPT